MAKRETVYGIVLPKRGFWHGVARLFDFSGSLNRATLESIRASYRNKPPRPTVEESMRETWQAVGDSMRWAIGEYEKSLDGNGAYGKARPSDAELLRRARIADLAAMLRDGEADQERIQAAKRSVDKSFERALANYGRYAGDTETR